VGLLGNLKFYQLFHKTTLQEAFETVAQINKELKRMELDGAFCKKIQTSSHFLHYLFSSFFANWRKSAIL